MNTEAVKKKKLIGCVLCSLGCVVFSVVVGVLFFSCNKDNAVLTRRLPNVHSISSFKVRYVIEVDELTTLNPDYFGFDFADKLREQTSLSEEVLYRDTVSGKIESKIREHKLYTLDDLSKRSAIVSDTFYAYKNDTFTINKLKISDASTKVNFTIPKKGSKKASLVFVQLPDVFYVILDKPGEEMKDVTSIPIKVTIVENSFEYKNFGYESGWW